ncbi:MAG: transaldolase [Armatimonadetes bacterium]|nr:transaldolase [Armatimonadota bacterium]
MNPLLKLQEEGVSVWLDYLSRDLTNGGGLKRFIDNDGMRGETSNPTIFQKSISEGQSYDAQIVALGKQDKNAEDICWELMVTDVRAACDVFRPLFDASGGEHGHVSLEVNPLFARDTEKSIGQGRDLWKRVDRPNLFIKVPATSEGLPVIETLLYEGINVNVTLLFAVQRYEEVILTYLKALERRAAEGRSVDILSVASFFVSRVDSEVEKRFDKLEAAAKTEADALRGKVAIANARVAYGKFQEHFEGSRFAALKAKGAKVQRPLWASTSTKNPTYKDTMYVDDLIGPDCVNTMPQETIDAFRDHGTVKRTLTAQTIADGHRRLEALAKVGVDLDDVTLNTLIKEGVQKFADSYNSLIAAVEKEREKLLSPH